MQCLGAVDFHIVSVFPLHVFGMLGVGFGVRSVLGSHTYSLFRRVDLFALLHVAW